MRAFRNAYERALEWLVIALMVVLAVEVTLGVVFRSIGASLIWYDEVASVLLGDHSRLLYPFRFERFETGDLHPVSSSPYPWS